MIVNVSPPVQRYPKPNPTGHHRDDIRDSSPNDRGDRGEGEEGRERGRLPVRGSLPEVLT